MFARARLRLTLIYLGLFALVIGAFSAVVWIAFATVLAPTFDLAPELTSQQAAEAAYEATLERIGAALIVGDLAMLLLAGAVAWVLASRTLKPIHEAHLRQRRFVADASHEMRTPLAAIRASAEGAVINQGSAEEMRGALQDVVQSTERLSRLTDDLLALARADEPLLDRRLEPLDLSVATSEGVEAFLGTHREHRLASLVLAPGLTVKGDPEEIRRIVENLVDNAFRYGAPGVSVQVTTFGTERDACVEVADDGPGLEAVDADRVFLPFYRVETGKGRPPGNGLGLAIARSLAERSGGRLTVASQAGIGATFRLSLPRFR